MQGLGSGTITLFGSTKVKEEYLRDVATGKKIAAFALTELESGSDVANMTSAAKDMGDYYLVNGTKTYISNGGIADYYVLFVRTGEAAGAKGLSAMVLDANTKGLKITERIEVIAPHPLATIKFDNCKIPKEKLLGPAGSGFKASMATLDIFRSTVGAAALGFARRALSDAVERTQDRHLFGAPLSELQLVQGMLAESAVDVDTSALLIYRAAWTSDTKERRVTREAAMAKMHATETAQTVIDKAMQIFGGMGVSQDTPLAHIFTTSRFCRIADGPDEVHMSQLAKLTIRSLARQ